MEAADFWIEGFVPLEAPSSAAGQVPPRDRFISSQGPRGLLRELSELLPIDMAHCRDLLAMEQVRIRDLFLRLVAEQLGSRTQALRAGAKPGGRSNRCAWSGAA